MIKQKIFRIFADLKFAVGLLLLISFCSILGTIIEQDQPIEVYKLNYPINNPIFGFLSWNLILKLGLNHVYQTGWFICLIVLFGNSLILCSCLQQLPILKIARRCQFFRTLNPFYRLKFSKSLNFFSFSKLISRITKSNYSIFQQKNILYCYKGLTGQIAPIIVHCSMILILFGTIISSLYGFKAQESIMKTESSHIQNILNVGPIGIIPNTIIRINDFWITYTKTKTVSQFYSDVSILNTQGNEIRRMTIAVNSPLIYKGVYYYQTNWNLTGLRLKLSTNEKIQYPLLNNFSRSDKIWLTFIETSLKPNSGLIILINNLQGYLSFYNTNGQFIGNLELNEANNKLLNMSLLELISSTGLQIKSDPGTAIIYLGFFFLMISTLISYITYSQVWLIRKEKKNFIGGNTNRATFEFEVEFLEFIK